MPGSPSKARRAAAKPVHTKHATAAPGPSTAVRRRYAYKVELTEAYLLASYMAISWISWERRSCM